MGTIRNNLDRYNEFSEAAIVQALQKVYLWDFIQSLPGGLDAAVTENGHNLSQGQRQLLCLARALLLNVKVVMMDEATASVDVRTDALIQKVLDESLKGITVITIAHRLETVQGQRVITLSDGRVAEASPQLAPHPAT